LQPQKRKTKQNEKQKQKKEKEETSPTLFALKIDRSTENGMENR